MTIFELYKRYGIRNVSNYSKPQIGLLKEFPIAKDVALYFTGSFTDVIPKEEGWLLDSISKNITVFTPDKFTYLQGKASKKFTLRNVLKAPTRASEKFYFTHNISKLDNVSKSLPVVISYAHLKKMYKFTKSISTDFDIVGSTIRSLCKDVSKGIVDRTTLIDIEIPNTLNSISEYTVLLTKGKNHYVKHYNSFPEFVMFELLKFIMPKYREQSIFKDLMDIENKKNMFFVLRVGGRFTLISLYDILAMDKDNVDSVLKKSGKDSIKVFIKYMLSFIVNSEEPITDDALDKQLTDLKDKVVLPSVKKKSIKKKVDIKEKSMNEIDVNLSKGLINEKQADKLKDVVKKSNTPIRRSKEHFKLDDNEVNLTDSTIVLDKRALKDPIGARDRKYINEQYVEDGKRMVEHLNTSGVLAVEKHEVVTTDSKINSIETHKITIVQANGRTKELIRHVPKPNKDGHLRINNNEYVLIKQKADRPIRKINNSKVSLTSAYGKLMLERGRYAKDNIGKGLYRILRSMNDDDTIPLSLLVEGNGKFKNTNLPYWYTRTAGAVRSFVINDMFFTFDYNNRAKYVKGIESVEQHGTFIGTKGKKPMVIKDDVLYKIDGKPVEIGKYIDVIGVDEDKLPLELVTIGIRGKQVPVILPILSYMSLNELLETLNITYTTHPSVRESNVNTGEYVVSFKDITYKFLRKDKEATLLLSGLHSIRKELKFYSVDEISSVGGFGELFSMLGYNKGDINELSLLDSMYIDPITADTLAMLNEPTTFPELLLRANELLLTDDYKSVNHIDGTILKSHDRINSMLYHTLVKELRVYKNSIGITNSSMTSDPYAVMRLMNEDGSRELVDDINPIASLKQKENTTLIGFLGRDKASIPLEARELDVTEVGIISEASKESSAVGITAYMSASPSMTDASGLNETPKELSPFNISSTATNLSPFGETDDGKRKLFNSVQAGSLIALNNQRVMPVLTGYEAVIPSRVDSKFVTSAIDDGTVISVGSKIVVKYKTKGKKSYSLKHWSSKETGGETYLHVLKTQFVKGESFKKGDTLTYDSTFFGPNIFDKGKVLYKSGIPVRVALFEDITNYEDSTSISKKYSAKASSNLIKVRSLIVDGDNDMIDYVKIGEKVEYTTPLVINRNVNDVGGASKDIKGKTLDILKDLVSDIPKAEVKGVVKDITVYYRKDLKDYKKSLRKFIEESDTRLMEEFNYTGKVDHTYSSNGVPLELNDIEIKYSIEYVLDMLERDKGVLQNQLKFTVGHVYDSIVTEDGDEVDITMSPTSIDARVVDSAYRGITTTTLMMKLTKDVIDMWE